MGSSGAVQPYDQPQEKNIMSEYIHISSSNPKRKGAPSTSKPRKSRPKVSGYIDIVETKSSSTKRVVQPGNGFRTKRRSLKDSQDRCKTGDLLGEPRSSAIEGLEGGLPIVTGADIDYGQTLLSCSTPEEVPEWLLAQQTVFKGKVDRGFNWRKLPDAFRSEADAILNEVGKVPAFMMNNHHLALEAFHRLQRQLFGFVSADPDNEVALITFISGDGGTSLDSPVIDVRNPRKKVNAVMRKMALNWFGMTDLAFFATIQHADGGHHLQRHEHVLAWGKNFIAKAQRMAAHHSTKFPPNVTKLPVIKVVRATDTSEVNLARLAAYLLKAPAKAKNWFERPDGKQIMNHSEANDRFIQFLRLAQLRSLLGFEDMVFAGGKDGVAIKSSLVTDMRGLAEAASRGRHPRHPDTLSTFWAEFNKELGQDHWAVPAILRS
jgi:hypothetical protein